MRPVLRILGLASAALLASCATDHHTDDVVRSRYAIAPDEADARRVYTTAVFLAGTVSSSGDTTSRPTVRPVYAIEIDATDEDPADLARYTLVVEVEDGETLTVPFEPDQGGGQHAHARATVRCPREWSTCERDASVAIVRDDSSTAASTFAVEVRVESHFETSRRDLGYDETAAIVRVSIP